MKEKLLPQSIEAECGVLGSIIIDPDALTLVADLLHPDDFYRDAHRAIYSVMLDLYRKGEPADFITICDALGERLDDVGGASYITSLINAVPTSGNIEHYARLVSERYTFRQLIHAAGQVAAWAYDCEPESLLKAETLIAQIASRQRTHDAQSLAALSGDYLSKLEKLHGQTGAIVGIPTGYRILDRITGGWQASDLIILAARPGMGKTALALNLASTAAQVGTGVGFYSLEMGREQLYNRLLARETGIDSSRLRAGKIGNDEWDRIVTARDVLDDLPIWIDDTGGLTVSELRSRARRLCAEHRIGLLVVDYLQLLQAKSESGKRYEDDVKEVTEISRALKGLAKELNVPVLALSQLNRSLESRQNKRPMLSDLRSSGSIEQDADLVLFLYRDAVYHSEPTDKDGHSVPDSYTELNIEKHRNGPVGDLHLYFDGAHTCFSEALHEA